MSRESFYVDDLHPFQSLGIALAIANEVTHPNRLDLPGESVANLPVDLGIVLA